MKKTIDRTGEKYLTNEGCKIEIVEYNNAHNCVIQFENSDTLHSVEYCQIKRGTLHNPNLKTVFGVGYIGVGKYKSKVNKVSEKSYVVWRNMLKRCYDDNCEQTQIIYKGCSVDEHWHNFQNFAEWFYLNYNPEYMDGWHLNKDILVKKNKVYSPKTCAFVPNDVNVIFTKRHNKRGNSPIGVRKKENKFLCQISIYGKRIHLGTFDTEKEAFQAYKVAKEQYIKEVADKWKDRIEPRVYQAMYNYQVEITD